MNRRELLCLAPCVMGLAVFRPRMVAKSNEALGGIAVPPEFAELLLKARRRGKPGIDSLEGFGMHPDDIKRI